MDGQTTAPPPALGQVAIPWQRHEGLRLILDSAHQAFVSIDDTGRVLMWNRAAEATFGWSEEEAAGQLLADLIIPERHREAHARGIERFMATGRGRLVDRRFEIEGLHRDGREIPVEIVIAPVAIEGRIVFNAFLHDITERRESEASAQRLVSLVESSEDAIMAGTLDGTITSWNPGAERLYGYTAAEMIGQSIARVRPEGHLDGFADLRAALAAGERMPSFETRELRKDGSLVDVSVSISPIVDAAGVVTGVSSIVRDITERRRAEAATHLLASVVESSDDAIIARELDGTVTAWNPGAERVLGYPADQMVGRSIAPVWREEPELFERMQAQLAAGERVPTFEARAVRGDGTVIDVSVTASPITGSWDRPAGVSVIFRDITRSKRAERELHEARNRFEGAFRNAPIGMALVDLEGRFLTVNPSLCRFLGRDEAQLLATDFRSITHPDDLASNLDLLGETLAGKREAYEVEKRYLRPDGTIVWASLSVSLVRDGAAQPLYLVSQLQDVTERKHAEEELARYSRHLTELALQDPLTGLRNYRDFQALLEKELQRSRRYDTQWSVVLLDVDGFRQINADKGHAEGDRVLRGVAAAIDEARRSSDLAARIGSDEFALVLPGVSGSDAKVTAERIATWVAGREAGVSVSYGTASWPLDGDSKELVLLRADMLLQAAKPGIAPATGPPAPESAPDRGGAMPGIRRILALARDQLGMDVAYLAEITESRQVFRSIAGDGGSFGVEEGAELPLEATYCQRMLDREIGSTVPDTALEPELRHLPITRDAGVGSYVGVPLALPGGRLYGTLCCASHEPTPELAERHVELMRFLAELIADQIERDEQEANLRRSQVELAGIHALLSALTARDQYTGEHSKTVVALAIEVARRLGLSEECVLEVEQVALLHDIGKVGIPDSILQKRGPLGEQEWPLMRQHPAIGARILAGTETLSHLAAAVKAEHERFDGRGYPDGLKGEQIPLASRIAFACDAYHAMTSDRPYRAAMTAEEARSELVRGAGSQFDPAVVEALMDAIDCGSPGLHTQVANGAPTELLPILGEVLDATVPRQIPVWEPHAGAGRTAALGEVRAVCRRCGTHVSAVVTQAAVGGSCGNCGGYELDLLEI